MLMTDKVPKNGYYDGRYIYDFFRIVMIFSGLAFSKESTPQSRNSEGLSLLDIGCSTGHKTLIVQMLVLGWDHV